MNIWLTGWLAVHFIATFEIYSRWKFRNLFFLLSARVTNRQSHSVHLTPQEVKGKIKQKITGQVFVQLKIKW